MADALDRKQRLAAALRENLYRRKQQQRQRRKNDVFLIETDRNNPVLSEKLTNKDQNHDADLSVRDQNRTD
jgi:hypothetical protein